MAILKMAAVLVVGSVFCQALVTHAQAQNPGREFAPGELIVGFKSGGDRGPAIQELNNVKDNLKVRGESIERLQVQTVGDTALKLRIDLPAKVRGEAASDPALELQFLNEIATGLKADPRVKYAHPNWIVALDPAKARSPLDLKVLDQSLPAPKTPPNDPAFMRGMHWHYLAPPVGMNAIAAWKLETGKADIVVAVLDTGILFDHPDIKGAGNVLPGYNFVSEGGRSPIGADPGETCSNSARPLWHGTHVAGTIGAVGSNNGRGITGVNWKVSVLPVRVIPACGGKLDDIAEAIRWAAGLTVDRVPRNPRRAHVINMSFGRGLPCNLETVGVLIDAIEAARAAGSVLVVAAGNEGQDIKDTFPAGCKGVISVAASDKNGRLASYSNYGNVTIMAPGGEIDQVDDANNPAGIWSVKKVSSNSPQGVEPEVGTSMAAPHVSGAIALALAKHPAWRFKPDLIEEKLRKSAAPLQPNACRSPCGVGQLDAAKLVASP